RRGVLWGKLGVAVTVVVAVVIAGAAVFAAVQLLRPMPALMFTAATPPWTAPSLIETRFSQILLSGRVYVIYGNPAAPWPASR
ncbi:MAG TPA: hypothetical protein VF933_10545, partial [Streptosporangiaceae bacterium]